MSVGARTAVSEALAALDPRNPDYAVRVVDLLLKSAQAAGASDLHFQPGPRGSQVRWRIDGVLHDVAALPAATAPNVVARLKVLADLLTYRSDLPQEGRIRGDLAQEGERRVSTFPSLHGERVVVRLFAPRRGLETLDDLGLPADVVESLGESLRETAGAMVICGPSGSGKTTTLYACLREIVSSCRGERSVLTVEDPIESELPGVAQAQVNPASGFGLARALRSAVRQDAEVIAVGEIRDGESAEVALGAALTGQLVLTTFHAGGAAEAVGRLLDLGIEPYVLRSGLRAVLFQRLVRRLCDCRQPVTADDDRLGLPVEQAWRPVGCPACDGTGYRGRGLLVEWLDPSPSGVGRAILSRSDVGLIEAEALASSMVSRWKRGCVAVEAGETSPAELRRVMGMRHRVRLAE